MAGDPTRHDGVVGRKGAQGSHVGIGSETSRESASRAASDLNVWSSEGLHHHYKGRIVVGRRVERACFGRMKLALVGFGAKHVGG